MSEARVREEPALGSPLPIRFSRVERFPGQPRTFFPKAGIVALAESIKQDGQEQPIKVTTKPGEPGKFILIDGERRLRAFEVIYERTGVEPIILAFVEVVKDLKEHFRKSTLANLHREDLVPLDEAAAYHRLKQDGESIEGLMRLRGRSSTYIDNYLKLHTLPDEVKAMMDPNLAKDEQLTVTQAIDIARGIPEKEPALRIEVAKEARERNLNAAETRSLVEQRSGKRMVRVSGRMRKPSDDYKLFIAFVLRTRKAARFFQDEIDFNEIFLHRDDEERDRRTTVTHLDAIISSLEKVRAHVKSS